MESRGRGISAYHVSLALMLNMTGMSISISVNTDDPGALDCTMDSEFQLLIENFGFGEVEFSRIFADSLAARFAPELRYPRP